MPYDAAVRVCCVIGVSALLCGCFAEETGVQQTDSDVGTRGESSATDKGADTTGALPDTGAMDPTAGDNTTRDPGDTDAETGCAAGTQGCPCDGMQCDAGLSCQGGTCEPIAATCGNGMLDLGDGETCDDANNVDGDGCTAACQWERHCLLEHLGGMGPTVGVRAFTLEPDGTLGSGAQLDIDGVHDPAAAVGPSVLASAAVRCGPLAYLALEGSGSIVGIGMQDTTPELVVQPVADAFVGVRELVCDPVMQRLFAVRVAEASVFVDAIDLMPNGELGATVEYAFSDGDFVSAESARISADLPAQRLHLVYTEAGTSQIPVNGRVLDMSANLAPDEKLSSTLQLNNRVHSVLKVPGRPLIFATGRRSDAPAVTARLNLLDDGSWGQMSNYLESPWLDRYEITSLRLPGGAIGFALAGTTGVLIAGLDNDDDLTPVGEPIAEGLSNTFARAAFNDRVLLVASPQGLATFGIGAIPVDGVWPELDNEAVGGPATFQSGAIVPCAPAP